jgi:hypothetical protein
MARISKADKAVQARNLMKAIPKHLGTGPLLLKGQKYTMKQVVALFQSHLDALDEVNRARVVFRVAVGKETALAKRVKELAASVKRLVNARFGVNYEVLGDFGWTPPKKPGPKTSKAKLAGVKKREARRAKA